MRHALALAINSQRLMRVALLWHRGDGGVRCCRGPRGPTIMTLKLPNIIRGEARARLKALGLEKPDPQAVGAHQLAGVESQPAENGGAYPGGYGADWR